MSVLRISFCCVRCGHELTVLMGPALFDLTSGIRYCAQCMLSVGEKAMPQLPRYLTEAELADLGRSGSPDILPI
jgi:hypothetical protein